MYSEISITLCNDNPRLIFFLDHMANLSSGIDAYCPARCFRGIVFASC